MTDEEIPARSYWTRVFGRAKADAWRFLRPRLGWGIVVAIAGVAIGTQTNLLLSVLALVLAAVAFCGWFLALAPLRLARDDAATAAEAARTEKERTDAEAADLRRELAESVERQRSMERAPVPADHAAHLHATLERFRDCVGHRQPCSFDDASASDREIFGAHYEGLANEVEAWNETVEQAALRDKLRHELEREAGEIDIQVFPDKRPVLDYVFVWVMARAEAADLDSGVTVAFGSETLPPDYFLLLGTGVGSRVGRLSYEPPETLDERAQAAVRPVQALASAAKGWPVAQEIRTYREAVERARPRFLHEIDLALKATAIRSVPDCPVCHRNLGLGVTTT
jgi:hypothetical protein